MDYPDGEGVHCSGSYATHQYQRNWPLAHNATYRNGSLAIIGRTDAYGRLPNPLSAPINDSLNAEVRVWTGMNADYTAPFHSRWFPREGSCLGWNTSSDQDNALIGNSNSLTTDAINSGTGICNERIGIYCAQIANTLEE